MSICKLGDDFTSTTVRQATISGLYADRDKTQLAAVCIITANELGRVYLGADRGVNGKWALANLGSARSVIKELQGPNGLNIDAYNRMITTANLEFISNGQGRGNCIDMQRQTGMSAEDQASAAESIRATCQLNPGIIGNAIIRAAQAAAPQQAGADPAALEEARAAKRAAEEELQMHLTERGKMANRLKEAEKRAEEAEKALAAATAGKPQEIIHESLEDAEADIVDGLHLYLYGPAGTGKSHGARQIAKRQGWQFASICEIRDEYADLLGFVAVDGKTRNETEFTRALDAAEQGEEVCIFFDEMDACVPEALTKLNSWLAGGTIEAAGKRYTMNSHVHVIAAGNTDGRGATAEYSSRSHLDAATLDRFSFIPWGYDARITAYRAGGAEAGAWLTELQRVVSETGSDLLVSYRAADRVKVALKHESEGRGNLAQAIKNNVFRGLTVQSVRALVNRMKPTCPQLDAAAKAIVAA